MTMIEVRHPLVRHKVGLLRAAAVSAAAGLAPGAE